MTVVSVTGGGVGDGCTVGSVPWVVTGCPGEFPGEGHHQIVHTPGNDDIVVEGDQVGYETFSHAHSCKSHCFNVDQSNLHYTFRAQSADVMLLAISWYAPQVGTQIEFTAFRDKLTLKA